MQIFVILRLLCVSCKILTTRIQFGIIHQKSILHWAAKFGQTSVIQYVCRFVDEKNPCDIWGVTPIHLAAENGHLEIVQYLMKYLTDDKNPKSYGCTSVLDMAARGGHLEVFKYLSAFSNSINLRASLEPAMDTLPCTGQQCMEN